MKKLFLLLITIIAISACGTDDSSTCTCKNADNVIVGTYTGLSEADCAEREVIGTTCTLE